MNGAAVLLATFAILVAMSLRADQIFVRHAALPMQFGPDGSPGWTLRRRWALSFSPLLAALILIPTALSGAGAGVLLFAGACLVAGHAFHLWLVARSFGGSGG